MNVNLLTLIMVMNTLLCLANYSQNDTIDYFGQEPPGYYPQLFAEDIFDGTVYTHCYSADGKQLYFSGNFDGYTIKYMEYINGSWSEQKEASFCISGSDIQDASPCFSPDGNRLYFCSNRDGGLGDYDLWYVEKNENGWGNPQNLGDSVNSSEREDYPFIEPNGTLLFNSSREGTDGFTDVYFSPLNNGTFAGAEKLYNVNSSDWDEHPSIVNNRLFIGLHDDKQLAVCERYDMYEWYKQEIISGGIFPKGFYDGYRVSPDGKYFIYSLDKTGTGSSFEIYWVDIETLDYLGVKEAPFNYVTSWYAGIQEQMEIALHPELIKRQITSNTSVSPINYASMLSLTNSCTGCIDTLKVGRKDIAILHESENIASAKILSNDFFDYLHLVKFENYWKVINVAWDYYDVPNIGDTAKLITLLDKYINCWESGDTSQMKSFIHPNYASRMALSHTEVNHTDRKQFLEYIAACTNCNYSAEYEILDIYLNTASVKFDINNSTEYLHLSYQNDNWYIINSLRAFEIEINTSSNSKIFNKQIKVFPNPTSQYIYLNIDHFSTTELNYQIFDLSAKVIKEGVTYGTISTSELIKGQYILKLSSETKIISNKIIVQ